MTTIVRLDGTTTTRRKNVMVKLDNPVVRKELDRLHIKRLQPFGHCTALQLMIANFIRRYGERP
jgi:hypothetical protein